MSIVSERRSKYEELFGVDETEAKARAFDEIAEYYYFGNFGTMNKSSMDTLMFSIYLNQILDKNEEDINSYSRYNLSRWLGITQSQVDNLKVKKQLAYPREFDWREQFLRLCSKADYKDGYISINIPDKNLYLEIKNAIDEEGGFVETTLTQNLLRVSEKYFVLLLMKSIDGESKKSIEDLIVKHCSDELKDHVDEIRKNIGEYTWKDVITGITDSAIGDIIDAFVPIGAETLKNAIEHIKKKRKADKRRKEHGNV